MSPPKDEPSGDVGGTSSQTLNTPSEDLPKNKNLKMEFGGCDREVHRPESLACSHQDGSPELVNETPEVEQFDKTGEIRRSREFFKTPLVSLLHYSCSLSLRKQVLIQIILLAEI